jgi:hypothetical protein
MGILHKFSAGSSFSFSRLSLNLDSDYCIIQKEGAYIRFSLSKAKLSNLHLMVLSTCIHSDLSALNLISVPAVQGRELICSRSQLIH